MTGEITKAIFETAKEGDAVEIVFDNEHHFFFYVMDAFPPFFDDEKECVVIMYPTAEYPNLQNFAPVKVTYAAYECIQQINVFHTIENGIEKFNEYAGKASLTEDQKERCMNMLHKMNSRVPQARGYMSIKKMKDPEKDKWGTLDTPRAIDPSEEKIIEAGKTYQETFETDEP